MLNLRLKELREKKGFSQAELARRVGVGRDSYNKYERAGIHPSNETLVRLSNELHTTTDYLLGKSNNPNPATLLIPDVLKDARVAFHRGEFDDLSQDEVDRLAEFASFIKSQRR